MRCSYLTGVPSAASVQANPSYYYHCLNHWAWGRHWIFLDSFTALRQVGGALFAIGFGAAWIWLVWFAGASPRLGSKRRVPEAVVTGAAAQREVGERSQGHGERGD